MISDKLHSTQSITIINCHLIEINKKQADLLSRRTASRLGADSSKNSTDEAKLKTCFVYLYFSRKDKEASQEQHKNNMG